MENGLEILSRPEAYLLLGLCGVGVLGLAFVVKGVWEAYRNLHIVGEITGQSLRDNNN